MLRDLYICGWFTICLIKVYLITTKRPNQQNIKRPTVSINFMVMCSFPIAVRRTVRSVGRFVLQKVETSGVRRSRTSQVYCVFLAVCRRID